jgi:hypothetical protein
VGSWSRRWRSGLGEHRAAAHHHGAHRHVAGGRRAARGVERACDPRRVVAPARRTSGGGRRRLARALEGQLAVGPHVGRDPVAVDELPLEHREREGFWSIRWIAASAAARRTPGRSSAAIRGSPPA